MSHHPQSPAEVARAILSLRPDPWLYDNKPMQQAHDHGHKLAREAAARLVAVSGASMTTTQSPSPAPVEQGLTEPTIAPTYYVKHPDDSYSVADPQPQDGLVMPPQVNRASASPAEPALRDDETASGVCISPLATRPILYTDTVNGQQACRDDLWAVTTAELNATGEQSSIPGAARQGGDTSQNGDSTTMECPECKGSGEQFGSFACEECGGQGKIIVSKSDLATSGHDATGAALESFKTAFLSMNGFHTNAELEAEWAHPSLSGMMFRAGIAAASRVDPSLWTLSHNGKQVTGVALKDVFLAADSLRTEEEQFLAAQRLMAAIDAELAEESAAAAPSEADKLDAEIAKRKRQAFILSQCIHNIVVGNQAAWIEWKHGKGAEMAMQWIENGLAGPGHIPHVEDGADAQAYFDANVDDRMEPTDARAAIKLAGAIAIHFGAEIGEHSSANCPWAEALDAIGSAAPVASVGQDRNAVLEMAGRACKAEFVEDTGTDGDTAYNAAINHCIAAIRALKSPAPAPVAAQGLLDELRALGLTVAVHNDYRLDGEAHTFWLMTDERGMSYKGEGKTDHEALTRVAMAVGASHQAAPTSRHDATGAASDDADIKTWPARIWLQHQFEYVPSFGVATRACSEITWCQDNIEKFDIEYVRADLAAAAPSEADEPCKYDVPHTVGATPRTCARCGKGPCHIDRAAIAAEPAQPTKG